MFSLPLMKDQGAAGRLDGWIVLIAGFGVPALLISAIPVTYDLMPQQVASAPIAVAKVSTPAAPVAAPATPPMESPGVAEFRQNVLPILQNECYQCHGNGESSGGLALDKVTTAEQLLNNPDLWFKVLKFTRAGIMPAEGHPRLSAQEQGMLDHWIKFAAFGINPQNFDPGRVTVHRLNRAEYRNTIHDLLGVDFDTDAAFPSDDIGYGFDNIADVLNTSPLLMEKYLAAAQVVVGQAVPSTSRVIPKQAVLGRDFLDTKTGKTPALDTDTMENGKVTRTAVKTSYFKEAHFVHTFHVDYDGDYRVVVERGAGSNFTFIPQSCTVSIAVDGQEMKSVELPWHGANSNSEKQLSSYDTIPVHWAAGDHVVMVSATPLSGVTDGRHEANFLLRGCTIEGPTDESKWVKPPNYGQFFTRDEAPADPAARRAYARELLGAFATKAFRRPAPEDSLDRLVNLAEKEYSVPGKTFEMGMAQAMVAVLASPRFLFRIDSPAVGEKRPAPFALVDEYSLASRLSYFLWSTMPDDELLKLAAAGQLRQNLAAQAQRMAADPRADALIKNFSGQWLQTRAVTNVPINAHSVFQREGYDSADSVELTAVQRNALAGEAEAYFGYVMRNDRSVDEFIESNYIFLNAALANYYYRDPNYKLAGTDMRKIDLAPGDWRGGVLTMGSVLMVTSNPTRTSPVKRGKWILENILDAPAPPPPPNIPTLDQSAKKIDGREPTMRETLAIHRADANCASCHDRMDPLGMALENFNALGTWREKDLAQPIDATGHLSTGEAITDIRDLKHTLITNHRDEFYRCLTEKLLTYALGRGTDYYDVPTVDKIVDQMDNNGGRFSALLQGVIESAAFQEERLVADPGPAQPAPIFSQNTPAHE